MSPPEPALFEGLNAKKLSPAEIAATFVIPDQYDQLVGPDNSILVGPRGSGKTTLLRMLGGEALMSWDHRRAAEYRRRVRFSSVFLPADRLWTSQLMAYEGADEDAATLGVVAFATQMLYALVETMLYRLGEYTLDGLVHHPADLKHRSEVELVDECAKAWKLDVRGPSLVSLQGALDLRLAQVAEMVDNNSRPDSWLTSFGVSALNAFTFGVKAFNRHSRQPNHRWGLLLDEMELAPESIHKALTGALRGASPNVVLKLSFSPFDRYAIWQQETGGALSENDFRPVYLWYGNRVGGKRFTQGLWRRMMLEQTEKSKQAIFVLGPSEIDVSGSSWAKEGYQTGSKQQRLIKDLAEKDSKLAGYLKENALDVDHMEDIPYTRRSATLRKIYPLLVFRDAMLDFENGMPTRRVRRKVTECFTGADAVFAALEGNPRWIKAVFSRLLAAYDGESRIERGLQYDTLRDAADRFESLLRVLPTEAKLSDDLAVLEVLNRIGRYFSDRAFGPFTPDPPSVFRVDAGVPDRVIKVLQTALSAGAVVHLRRKQSPPVLSTLIGEHFRLAYLLTIRDGFEAPFRIGKARDLSTILNATQANDTLFSLAGEV